MPGRRFDFETLMALTHASEDYFLHTIDGLVQRRLLVEEQQSGIYDFSHDKVREVVYRDIGTARLVLLHRAVAEKLEQQPLAKTHEHDARLAEHFECGKVWSKAIHYLSLATNHSQALFAMRESLQWLDRAVALIETHPEAATVKMQLDLYEQRGEVRTQAGQMREAVLDFQRVISAAREQGEHAHARDVLIQLGMAYRRADAYEQAVVCLDEALPRLEALKLVRYQIMANDALGCLFLDLNQVERALQHFRHGLELAGEASIQYWVARLQAKLAIAQLRLGLTHDQAALLAAQQYTDKHQERWLSLRCLEALALSALTQGDKAACIGYANQLSLLASAGTLQVHGQASYLRGLAALAARAHESAKVELTKALTQAEKIGQVHLAGECHHALAQVACWRGDAEKKARHQARADALAENMIEGLRGSGLTADLKQGFRLGSRATSS